MCRCANGYYGMYCQFRRLNPIATSTTTTTRNPLIPTTINNSLSICAFVICQNGGICNVLDQSRFICLCQSGFFGQFCQNSVAPTPPATTTTTAGFIFDICLVKNCQNGIYLNNSIIIKRRFRQSFNLGGICNKINTFTAVCVCASGWNGENCEIPTAFDICILKNCQNGK
jgi:hypothetical protein